MITVKDIAVGLNSVEPLKKIKAVQAVRKILSHKDDAVINYGSKRDVSQWITIGLTLIPKLTQFLDDAANPKLQLEAAWALEWIATPQDSLEECLAVVSAGAVTKLFALLKSKNAEIIFHSARALGNLVNDDPRARDILLDLGLVEQLADILQPEKARPASVKYSEGIAYLVRCICDSFSTNALTDKIDVQLLPTLAKFIQSSNQTVLDEVCLAYLHSTKVGNCEKIQAVVDSGVLPRLVELLQGTHAETSRAILSTVGVIINKDTKFIEHFLDANIIPKLLMMLVDKDVETVESALSAVREFMRGNHQQIQKILDSGVFKTIENYLRSKIVTPKLKTDWAVTISNFFLNASKEQIVHALKRYNIIKPFCEALASSDCTSTLKVLEGLEALTNVFESDFICILLKESCGIIKLKKLKDHQDENVQQKANHLLKTYFNDIEDVKYFKAETDEENETPKAKRKKTM